MKLALITNFELLGPPQAERFNRLSLELEKRDTRLLLLTTNLHPALKVLYLQIPYALRDFTAIGVKPVEVPNCRELLAVEEHWIRNFSHAEASVGAGCCRSFYGQLLEILEPDLVAPWNALLPQSRIVQLLCEEKNIPVFTFERGFLPDTLMLERLRNNVESELNNSVALASVARDYPANHKLLARYREYYNSRSPAKYSTGSAAALAQQKSVISNLDAPLVLALSQAHGGGIYPREDRVARRNFAHFSSLEDALQELSASCGARQLAFRDHPINRMERRPTQVPDDILRLDEGPFCEVLPAADLVVSFGSTTAIYEALLLEKPLIVVGDTPVGRFEPYVRSTDGNLKAAIEEALDPERQAGHKRRASAALSFLLEHFLFAERDEVPLPKGVADLATFIASFDGSCSTELDTRFERFHQWVSA